MILDAGALIAVERGDDRALRQIATARGLQLDVLTPAVAVAEVVRGEGPRSARLRLFLASVPITPTTAAHAWAAGRLLARAGSNQTIDALVVAEAVLGAGGLILTGDPDDLRALAVGEPGVTIVPL
jgi:predicted nucleic acid-binding protein